MNHTLNQLSLTVVCIGGLAGIFLLPGCKDRSASQSSSGKPPEAARTVRVTQAAFAPVVRTVKSFGSLAAYDQATVSMEVAGRIESLAVDLGAVVRKGDVIAQIDPRDYRLQVQQAEALLAQARVRLGLPLQGEDDSIAPEQTSTVRQMSAMLEEARANRERIRSLSAQKITSKSEVETVEAAYEVAVSRHEAALQEARVQQAQVAQRRVEWKIARQQLDNTTLRAPFDAVVQERRASLGEYLSASVPVVTLVRVDPLRLKIEVSEREAPRIAIGQRVRVSLQSSTNVYVGEVKRLSPALDEQSRMLRVEADVPNPGHLRPGSFVTAEIVVNQTDQAVVVPADAIVTFAGIEKVFVVQSGKAVERSIFTGQRVGNSIEVLKGVTAGETVIHNPGNLRTGQAVEVQGAGEMSTTE